MFSLGITYKKESPCKQITMDQRIKYKVLKSINMLSVIRQKNKLVSIYIMLLEFLRNVKYILIKVNNNYSHYFNI